jgi:magnesium-transporting ATPase (P-type)
MKETDFKLNSKPKTQGSSLRTHRSVLSTHGSSLSTSPGVWLARKASAFASLLWFSGRLTLGFQALALVAIAGGILVFVVLTQRISGEPSVFRVLLGIEASFFVVLAMGLLPREKEARTLELLLVCSRSRQGLLTLKFAPVCLFVAAVAVGLTTAFYWFVGGFSWGKMLYVPYGLAATVGILTVVLTTYVRNQYAAGVLAVLIALVVTTMWLDPFRSFYAVSVDRMMMQAPPNVTINRVLLVVVFGFLYDHAVRRLKHVELWMR